MAWFNWFDARFLSEPNIELTIVEIVRARAGQQTDDFQAAIFATHGGRGYLTVVKNVEREGNTGLSLSADFLLCESCVPYTLTLTNVGKRTAKNIFVELQGDDTIHPFDIKDVPRSVNWTCGSGNHKCNFRLDKLEVKDRIFIPLFGKSGTTTISFSCDVNGRIDMCKKDYINALSAALPGDITDISVGGKKVLFPAPEFSDEWKCYQLDIKSLVWSSTGCASL
mgnify:CR=1 FL=1